MDIQGPLPNRIFTLIPSTVLAVLLAGASSDVPGQFFLCRKFLAVWNNYNRSKRTTENMGSIISLFDGRLFSYANNIRSKCGVNKSALWLPFEHWVRLPPVMDYWVGCGSWFAQTTRGLFAWGSNWSGQLGIASYSRITRPCRVSIPQTVMATHISVFNDVAFIRISRGWLGVGLNDDSMLGLPNGGYVTTPTMVPGAENVIAWTSNRATFGITRTGLLGCGSNARGQLGIDDDDAPSLTPIRLPRGAGPVRKVVTDWESTFILCGQKCFVCGANDVGQLALGVFDEEVHTPTELSFPVNDVVAHKFTIIFLSAGKLLGCGANDTHHVSPDGPASIITPVALNMPWSVRRVTISHEALFVQRSEDDTWFARGNNKNSQLGVGSADDIVTDWAPVLVPSVTSVGSLVSGHYFINSDGVYCAGRSKAQNASFWGSDVDHAPHASVIPQRLASCPTVRSMVLPTMVIEGGTR